MPPAEAPNQTGELPPSSIIDAGAAVGGSFSLCTTSRTFTMTGGFSGAPRAKTEQLRSLIRDMGVQNVIIRGAEAEGASVDLGIDPEAKVVSGSPSSGTVPTPSIIASGSSRGGQIEVSKNKFEATGGVGHAPRLHLSDIMRVTRVTGATKVQIEGGNGKGAEIHVSASRGT